ncbi:DUF742 domain-containing protein [Streptomyces sp. L2]|uniref:DUF742 domain-containing protein n=1 Tax=Streptomyces sp. L2 TaxID=2162665 RepID=UPI0010129939|nr:DUF742 domain-containing protein [Streptomyces sp. L2]
MTDPAGSFAEHESPGERFTPPTAGRPAPAGYASGYPAHPLHDDEAGPLVRLYAMTRGRTRTDHDGLFGLVVLVEATAGAEPPGHPLSPEERSLLELCRGGPSTVADLVSAVGLPLGVVRVLLGDLHRDGLIHVRRAAAPAQLPDEHILREVINGIRAL